MVAALEFTDLVKHFGRHTVLSRIQFEVRPGEFLGLVGLNGAGKSTLIKCLLDFCAIDGGMIKIFGESHRNNSARARLTFLPEKFIPPYYLAGKDFLTLMSDLHGHSYDARKAMEILNILDLEPAALARPVYQYSKGMVQKLGLAACLLSNKELLVLDEPMSGLDPRAMACLKQHLTQMKQQGYTLFFSTHQLVDVEALCDRMAILHAGEIRFIGTPDECKSRYQVGNLEQAYIRCVNAVSAVPVKNSEVHS